MTSGGDAAGYPPLATVAMQGRCPRCGAPGLFDGLLRFAQQCRACGLDYTAFNVGDGPAALITLVFGAIVTTAALVVELRWSPPWWLHVILWLPLTVVGAVVLLRWTKAALLALEYRNAAREGRIAPPAP